MTVRFLPFILLLTTAPLLFDSSTVGQRGKGEQMTVRFFPFIFLFTIAICCSTLRGQEKLTRDSSVQSVADPWVIEALLKPDSLKEMMSGPTKGEIVIIHTGPTVLFKKGHIPGAVAVGQVSDSAGVKALKEQLQKLSKEKKIVLYCGCCPWKNCPNIRPAYTITCELGFKNVKVLDLPNNFRSDWSKKGFPVEK